jgi:hypothetical protein
LETYTSWRLALIAKNKAFLGLFIEFLPCFGPKTSKNHGFSHADFTTLAACRKTRLPVP